MRISDACFFTFPNPPCRLARIFLDIHMKK
jgi:hypothetical protein